MRIMTTRAECLGNNSYIKSTYRKGDSFIKNNFCRWWPCEKNIELFANYIRSFKVQDAE